MDVSATHTVHHQGYVRSSVDGVALATTFLNQTLVKFPVHILQGWRKPFITGQAKHDPEHYSIKCMGSR